MNELEKGKRRAEARRTKERADLQVERSGKKRKGRIKEMRKLTFDQTFYRSSSLPHHPISRSTGANATFSSSSLFRHVPVFLPKRLKYTVSPGPTDHLNVVPAREDLLSRCSQATPSSPSRSPSFSLESTSLTPKVYQLNERRRVGKFPFRDSQPYSPLPLLRFTYLRRFREEKTHFSRIRRFAVSLLTVRTRHSLFLSLSLSLSLRTEGCSHVDSYLYISTIEL